MEKRETFVAYGDLLRELAAQCRASQECLRRCGRRDVDGTDKLADWVARREGRLAEGLERCADAGPSKLVKRMLQYKPEHRCWQNPADCFAALEQTVAVNHAISEALQEEMRKSAPLDISEQMHDLMQQVDAINRKVSLAMVTSQDL
jgi:hypothetical protein